MRVDVVPDAEAVARRGADLVAAAILAGPSPFHLAVSGGTTPARMFARLAEADLPWSKVHLWQVDERLVPAGDPARNLGLIERSGLATRVGTLHPIPVPEDASAYATEFAHWGATLDLVHLGLGADGHTASLVPGDAARNAPGDVAVTGPYQGHRRVTLTFPVLARARAVLWLVAGADKAPALTRLLAGDPTLVATRVGERPGDRLVADTAARPGG